MSTGRFARIRLIRLYPMIVLAIIVGLVRIIARGAAAPEFAVDSGVLAWWTLLNVFMIPDVFNRSGLFPINGVLWSLFYELAANVLYAALIRRLTAWVLVAAISCAFLGLAAMAGSGLDSGFRPDNWYGGLLRIVFSFSLGILLYRWRQQLPVLRVPHVNGFVLACVLVGILMLPSKGTGYLQLFAVTVIFPVILILGANDVQKGFRAKIAAVSGAISYPLYAIHLPLLWLVTGVLKKIHLYNSVDPRWLALPVAVGIGVISWVVLKAYDEPIRAWLGQVLNPKKVASEVPGGAEA